MTLAYAHVGRYVTERALADYFRLDRPDGKAWLVTLAERGHLDYVYSGAEIAFDVAQAEFVMALLFFRYGLGAQLREIAMRPRTAFAVDAALEPIQSATSADGVELAALRFTCNDPQRFARPLGDPEARRFARDPERYPIEVRALEFEPAIARALWGSLRARTRRELVRRMMSGGSPIGFRASPHDRPETPLDVATKREAMATPEGQAILEADRFQQRIAARHAENGGRS